MSEMGSARRQQRAYRAAAKAQAPLLIEHSAMRAVDTWCDDVPPDETTDFQRAVSTQQDAAMAASARRRLENPDGRPRIAPDPKIWDAYGRLRAGR
ncbi:DUF1428 family protein [Devosia sp. ZW T5_3]|uniref:DUF1428 family protein n=1 Tax=Devosia sp. ZW T5_3 TaxID=3378085 RepID=UPI003851C070